jgi:2'-5' RNA ligase
MIRLFVGLPLVPSVRDHLAILSSGLPAAHWTPPANLHVTLRFIGEIDEATAGIVHDHLATIRAPAFDLGIAGCGAFGTGRHTHTLWVGVDHTEPLQHLRDKVQSAVVRAGLEPERRKFKPHITLARLREPPLNRLHTFIAAHNLLRDGFRVESFTLFSSRLGHGDPVYTAEAVYPLEG